MEDEFFFIIFNIRKLHLVKILCFIQILKCYCDIKKKASSCEYCEYSLIIADWYLKKMCLALTYQKTSNAVLQPQFTTLNLENG